MVVFVSADASSHLTTDLEEFTEYRFDVYASTRVGAGPSDNVSTRTDESCKAFCTFSVMFTVYFY